MKTKEQEQLSIEEKSKLFVELLEKRKKHFAALRAQEKRNKPSTKAQKRNTMSIYLKNMVGYKHNQLKSKSYDEIQKMFDKEMKRVNTFVDMDTELVKGSKTKAEGSFKRTREELESDNSKKQRIIRADRSSKGYSSMIRMLQDINREDLETLWKLVKAKHGNTRPEEAYERVLYGKTFKEELMWTNAARGARNCKVVVCIVVKTKQHVVIGYDANTTKEYMRVLSIESVKPAGIESGFVICKFGDSRLITTAR
ncbi:hypothetical protein Tco_1328494 [Tanacetum coccineum]